MTLVLKMFSGGAGAKEKHAQEDSERQQDHITPLCFLSECLDIPESAWGNTGEESGRMIGTFSSS